MAASRTFIAVLALVCIAAPLCAGSQGCAAWSARSDPARCLVQISLPTCAADMTWDLEHGISANPDCPPPQFSLCKSRLQQLKEQHGDLPIYVIAAIGVARHGKSFCCRLIQEYLGVPATFVDDNGSNACTFGADFDYAVVTLPDGKRGVLVILDVEGLELGDARTHMQLLALAGHGNALAMFVTTDTPNHSVIEKISRLAWLTNEMSGDGSAFVQSKPRVLLVANKSQMRLEQANRAPATEQEYARFFFSDQPADSVTLLQQKRVIRTVLGDVSFVMLPTGPTRAQSDKLARIALQNVAPVSMFDKPLTALEWIEDVLPVVVQYINKMDLVVPESSLCAPLSQRQCNIVGAWLKEKLPDPESAADKLPSPAELESTMAAIELELEESVAPIKERFGPCANACISALYLSFRTANATLRATVMEGKVVVDIVTTVHKTPQGPIRTETITSKPGWWGKLLGKGSKTTALCFQNFVDKLEICKHYRSGHVECEWANGAEYEATIPCS